MASGKSESHRIFQAIDSLLANEKPQPVLEITESMLRDDPHDWEALYRQGLALEELGKPKEAAARFQKLLELPVGDDEKSAFAKAQAPNPRLQAPGAPTPARPSRRQATMPLEERIGDFLHDPPLLQAHARRPPRAATPGRRPTSGRRGWRPWAGW